MTDQLFKKVACFTDIHFGKKNNQRQHNVDCENFVQWFCKEAKDWGADTCIFLGDWHDTRRFLNVSTMNYTVSNLKLLNDTFEQVFVIMGNHDLFYREKREINSVIFGDILSNIKIIEEPLTKGDVTFLPWLVDEEWKTIPKIKSKYIFGHFELPHFKMNAMVDMPDLGGINASHFVNQDFVFSGHFHKRQRQKNVFYIGNAFPHNYSDAWDDERGMMFLEWGQDPTFKAWPDAPSYRTMKLSELLEDPESVDKYIITNTSARISLDIDITYEEAGFLKDFYVEQYGAREINLLPMSTEDEGFEFGGDIKFQSVDQIVITGLQAVESTTIDTQILIEIYNSLS